MTFEQSNTLVYVEKELAVAIAAKIVGILKSNTTEHHIKGGANWLVTASLEKTKGVETQTDIRELLSEDIIYYIAPKIENRFGNISEVLPKFNTTSANSFIPGNVVSICGKLSFPNMPEFKDYSPFYENSEIEMPVCHFHGEKCLIATLSDGNYQIPVYFSDVSKYQLIFCNNQPVEITGIVRWVPPYTPGGAHSLNLAVRGAALWLR